MPDQTTADPPPAQSTVRLFEWYTQLPAWGRVVGQLGAMGLICLLFTLQFRQTAAQAHEFVVQGNADRAMFREELKELRLEARANREGSDRTVRAMEDAVRAMQDAVRAMTNAERKMAGWDGPEPAPTPKRMGGGGGP